MFLPASALLSSQLKSEANPRNSMEIIIGAYFLSPEENFLCRNLRSTTFY